MKLIHTHLTVNASVGFYGDISKEDAQAFITLLLKEINMKPLGDLNWADAKDLEFPGQSFVQMITTSHTSLHYFKYGRPRNNEIYFDLYSCRDFDVQQVIDLLNRRFSFISYHAMLYTRAADSKPKLRVIKSL